MFPDDVTEENRNIPLLLTLDTGDDLVAYPLGMKVKTGDEDGWVKWREGLVQAIGGSDFASFAGSGYITPNKAMRYYLGLEERPKPNRFAQSAIDHGIKFERHAKQIIRAEANYIFSVVEPEELWQKEEVSYGYLLVSKQYGLTLEFCITPDMISTREAEIIEIKCPFYGNDQFDDPHEFREWYLRKHGESGTTAHFLQAALYAYLTRDFDDGPTTLRPYAPFTVCRCFVCKEELLYCDYLVFDFTPEVRQCIADVIFNIMEYLKNSGKKSRFTVPLSLRNRIDAAKTSSYKCAFTSMDVWFLDISGGMIRLSDLMSTDELEQFTGPYALMPNKTEYIIKSMQKLEQEQPPRPTMEKTCQQ